MELPRFLWYKYFLIYANPVFTGFGLCASAQVQPVSPNTVYFVGGMPCHGIIQVNGKISKINSHRETPNRDRGECPTFLT